MKVHPLLLKGRFLFVVNGCPHCTVWKTFIDRVNSELKLEKQIRIIDCTEYHDFGIIKDPVIRLFRKYIQGSYPVIFFENRRKDGTNTRVEAEAWLRARVHDDFNEPRYNEHMFNKECRYGARGLLKRRIICN